MWSTQLLQRMAFLVRNTSKLQTGLRAQHKSYRHFPYSFPTLIFTPQSDNHNQSYGLHNEQGSKHIKNKN